MHNIIITIRCKCHTEGKVQQSCLPGWLAGCLLGLSQLEQLNRQVRIEAAVIVLSLQKKIYFSLLPDRMSRKLLQYMHAYVCDNTFHLPEILK